MLRRPCGRAMRSKGRVGVDAVASKPGVAKEVLPLTRRILRLRLLTGGAGVNTTPCRTHGLKSGACRRPETERQGLPMRPSHDSVRRSESSLHTVGPPVLLNSIIGTPGGRYMRLVTLHPFVRGSILQSPQEPIRLCPNVFVSTVFRGRGQFICPIGRDARPTAAVPLALGRLPIPPPLSHPGASAGASLLGLAYGSSSDEEG